MSLIELASVDGEIGPTAEATIALRDDGLYRGDGVFEVIRLYGGHPFALAEHLDRIERSAAAIELPVDRAKLEPEIEALLARHGDADGQLRILLTRGGRRIVLTEELPEHDETLRLATVTYAPERHPHRRQVALLCREHAGDPDRRGPGRRRGVAGPPRRDRPRGADVDGLLGLRPGAAANARRSRPGSSSRSPARR